MGTVYEAYQDSMRRKVALKVLDAGLFPSEGEFSRFEREAWIGGRLSHPNIVKAFGQGVAGASRYIAMELVEGDSLASFITKVKAEREQRPQPDSAWRAGHIRKMVSLFVGVADALHYVHQQGIVHRDIKPLNLLLSSDGTRLLLTDFGVARDAEASRVTRKGEYIGTIRYMSPEQLLAQRALVDHRSDIWSLGVSLYEALTLDLPYSADTEEAYISAVSMKDPLPARARSLAVSRDLETVLMMCLERDPDRRYSSAADLKDDLVRFLEDRPVLARRPGILLKTIRLAKRHRVPLMTATIGSVLAALVVGTLMRGNQGDTAGHVAEPPWPPEWMSDSPPILVTDGVVPPVRTEFVKPEYPRGAQVARVGANVILELIVGLDGEVEAVRIIKSIPGFDDKAIEAVRKWKYKPALREGQPVRCILKVIIDFSVREKSGSTFPE
jgi:hypothetical protein